jgi:serine-type D-Ala-D-Ala carboxypeptidase/endopeptidase (penicillin-binding protein 4)
MLPISFVIFAQMAIASLPATDTNFFVKEDWNSYFTSSNIYFGVGIDAPENFQKNPSEWMVPASNAKILIGGELLQMVGADFRFRTEIRIAKYSSTQAKLLIYGEGDPTWGMSEFGASSNKIDAIVETLLDMGIQEVAENIELHSRFPNLDTISFPFGWKNSDLFTCGGTLSQSFNFDINCSTLEILSATSYRWTSKAIPTPVELQISLGNSTDLTLELKSNPWRYIVKGNWKTGSEKKTFYLPVYDTKTWIKNLLEEKLREKGIARFTPKGNPEFWESRWLESPPLAETLKPYLKNSVNFLGDAFLKTIGVISPSFRSLSMHEEGLRILKDRLYPIIGNLELYDGSGLSRIAKIRPEQMISYLQYLSNTPNFPVYLEALAVAGVDGTLKNRMQGTAAQGNLRAKTGTLNGVYNLSGFVLRQSQWIPFVIFTRTDVGQAGMARSIQDKVGARLAEVFGNRKQDLPTYPFIERNSGEFWVEQSFYQQ